VSVRDHLIEQEAPGFRVSPFVVNAGPEAMEALLANRIDVACVGPSPALNTYIKSGGKALRIVAGVCTGGASLMARQGTPIGTIADLAGKRVADPDLGGTQDVSLRHFLRLNGLAPSEQGGSVEIVPLKNPDILASFKRGQVDAAWVPEPWASRLQIETHARRVVDERDLWPNGKFTTAVLVVRTQYLQQHPDVVAAVERANRNAIVLLNREPVRAQEEANAEIAHLTGKPLKKAVLAESWGRLSFSSGLDRQSLAAFANAARESGYLRSASVDLSAVCFENQTDVVAARQRPE
jgi:NitT/TauT family transport system substrate-binding protein